MKKLFYLFLLPVIFLLLFDGCSKSNSEKLIGKWKIKIADSEAVYEFTNTNLIIEMKTKGMDHPKINTTYTIKSSDNDKLIITVVHPVTGEKGDFTAIFKGNSMDLTDPDGQTLELSKE